MKKETTVSNNSVYVAIIVALIGLFIVMIPVMLKNTAVKGFVMDTFNLVVLVIINLALYLFDVRIGVVFSILLISFISYAKIEGLTFSNPNFFTQETPAPTTYADQFKLMSEDVPVEYKMPATIETFDDCDNSDKLPSQEAFVAKVEDEFKPVLNVEGTEVNTTVMATPTQEHHMPVAEYMKRLEGPITHKLADEANFDVVGCRYDMTDAAQNTTLNGPPLGWNSTYKSESVNGQLFYPMHG